MATNLSPELEQRIRDLAGDIVRLAGDSSALQAWRENLVALWCEHVTALVEQAQAEALQSLAAKADSEDVRDWVLFHAQERKQPLTKDTEPQEE